MNVFEIAHETDPPLTPFCLINKPLIVLIIYFIDESSDIPVYSLWYYTPIL